MKYTNKRSIIIHCGVVLLATILTTFVAESLSFPQYKNDLAESWRHLEEEEVVFGSARDRPDDTSDEDSDEDDDEDDAEKAQQAVFQQQAHQESELSREDSAEDGSYENGVVRRRRKRDVESNVDAMKMMMKQEEMPVNTDENKSTESPIKTETLNKEQTEMPENTEKQSESVSENADANENPAIVSAGEVNTVTENPPVVGTTPSPETSVLISIREALKKVIAEISTQQVAASALEYFQAFEHFIQKTIEQVIDEEDEDEAQPINFTTVTPPLDTLPDPGTDEIIKNPEEMPITQDHNNETSEMLNQGSDKTEPIDAMMPSPQPTAIPLANESAPNTV